MGIFLRGLSKHLTAFPDSSEQKIVSFELSWAGLAAPGSPLSPKDQSWVSQPYCLLKRTSGEAPRREREVLPSAWSCPSPNRKARGAWGEGVGSRGRAAACPKLTGTQCGQRGKQSCQWTGCCPAACLLLISASRGGTRRSQLGPAEAGSWHWETQASFETKCFLPHPYFACNCMHMLDSAAKVASASGVHLACCTWARTCIPISAGWLCPRAPPPPPMC